MVLEWLCHDSDLVAPSVIDDVGAARHMYYGVYTHYVEIHDVSSHVCGRHPDLVMALSFVLLQVAQLAARSSSRVPFT
jgi:hypothetical protein